MMQTIGHKLELFNGYRNQTTESDVLKEPATDILVNFATFTSNIISFYRKTPYGEHLNFRLPQTTR